MKKVIDNKVSPEKIISSLPVKTHSFLQKSYGYGVRYFVFDCREELEKLLKYTPDAKKIMRVYVKDIDRETYRWGIKFDDFLKSKGSDFDLTKLADGIAIQISRNYQITLLDKLFFRLESFIKEFALDKKLILNIGGGLYERLPDYLEHIYDLEIFYSALNNKLDYLKQNYNLTLYCEPGRGVVNSACNLLLSVQLVQVRDGKNIIFVNLNAYKFGSLPYKIDRIRNDKAKTIFRDEWVLERNTNRKKICYTVVDTICEWNVLFQITSCEEIQENDILKLYGVGAYSVCLSSDFHSRDRIESVIV